MPCCRKIERLRDLRRDRRPMSSMRRPRLDNPDAPMRSRKGARSMRLFRIENHRAPLSCSHRERSVSGSPPRDPLLSSDRSQCRDAEDHCGEPNRMSRAFAVPVSFQNGDLLASVIAGTSVATQCPGENDHKWDQDAHGIFRRS